MSERSKPKCRKSPSINAHANSLVERLIADAALLGLGVERFPNGTRFVDAGIDSPGGIEAGRRIAQICLGGLGEVRFFRGDAFERWPLGIHVHTCNPVLACLGSQYAGWSLSHGEGRDSFRALGSGPARCLALKEPLFKELDYRDAAARTCLVLEVDRPPPEPLADRIARDCGVDPEALTLLLTPTRSLAGSVQVCARVLEVALHKIHELGFPLENVVDGAGSAPLAPPAPDFVQAMGRTNDAILFGGKVQLYVRGDDETVQRLAESLPSSASRDYGRPFADIFKAFEYDFFKIDPMLFSPAQVVVSALDSGRTFHCGKLDRELLELSFGGATE